MSKKTKTITLKQFQRQLVKDGVDPLDAFKHEQDKLIARGATGLSPFVRRDADASTRDFALEAAYIMSLMTRENSHSDSCLVP